VGRHVEPFERVCYVGLKDSEPSNPQPPPPVLPSSIPARHQRIMTPPNPLRHMPGSLQPPENTQTTNTNDPPSRSAATTSASALSERWYSTSPNVKLEGTFAKTQRPRTNVSSDGIKRNYQNREHIYAKMVEVIESLNIPILIR
jgi:hypothetical protein